WIVIHFELMISCMDIEFERVDIPNTRHLGLTRRGRGGTGRRTSLRGWREEYRGGSNPLDRTNPSDEEGISRVNEMSRGTLQSTSKISFIRLTQLNLREFFHTI